MQYLRQTCTAPWFIKARKAEPSSLVTNLILNFEHWHPNSLSLHLKKIKKYKTKGHNWRNERGDGKTPLNLLRVELFSMEFIPIHPHSIPFQSSTEEKKNKTNTHITIESAAHITRSTMGFFQSQTLR